MSPKPHKIEVALEKVIFASRWLLVPFFLGLIVSIVVLLVKFFKEMGLLIQGVLGLIQHEGSGRGEQGGGIVMVELSKGTHGSGRILEGREASSTDWRGEGIAAVEVRTRAGATRPHTRARARGQQ